MKKPASGRLRLAIVACVFRPILEALAQDTLSPRSSDAPLAPETVAAESSPSPAPSESGPTAETERVIVTGSNIPTAEEVGPNPVLTINRDLIEKGGERTTEGTDSIVGENADRLETAQPGEDDAVPAVENENADEPAPAPSAT